MLMILLGRDRPGIIATVADILKTYNINIEFSDMIARERIFLMELMVDIRHCAIPLENLQEVLRERMGALTINALFQSEDVFNKKKRILLFDGEPYDHALARIPAEGESRGNLAVGARGEGRKLTDRDRWICQRVGPVLREKGILFAGLDVIGDYLTEINVTSPTGIRELERAYGDNLAGRLFDAIESALEARFADGR